MRWEKCGLLWVPHGEAEWAHTHAQLPVVQVIAQDRWWVYLSTRDSEGKSRGGRLVVDVGERLTVRRFETEPVLSLGEPGTFDDCGVMPSWLVSDGDVQRMYYIGWNVPTTVPYRLAIGMAISDDGGTTFRRFSPGPIVDRSTREPFFVTTPCVLKENGTWRMWYVSCTAWRQISDRWEPAYHVKYAESHDGIIWDVTGISCIDAGDDYAIARPCVFRNGSGYAMLYSIRSLTGYRSAPEQAYRLGYAESEDGIRWKRMDEQTGLRRSEDGWDSEMVAYCWLQRHADETYLLYNGNGFGRSGVGVARLVE